MTVTYCDIRAGAAKKDKFGSGAESARKWTELQLKKIKWSTWWATMMAAVEVRDWVGERAGQRRGQFAPIARFQLRLSSWTPAPYPYKAKSAGTQRGGELCGWEHLADVSRRCFLSFFLFYLFFVSYSARSASQTAMTQSIRLSIDKNTNNSSNNNNNSGRKKWGKNWSCK